MCGFENLAQESLSKAFHFSEVIYARRLCERKLYLDFSGCLAACRPYSLYNLSSLVYLRHSTGLTTFFLILVKAMLANI